MNFIRIDAKELIYVEHGSFSYSELIERLAVDELSVFYVCQRKSHRLIGVLDKDSVVRKDPPSLDKNYIVRFSHVPTSSEIQNILIKKSLRKLVVLVNDEVLCEYRNLEYGFFARQIYRNYASLRYISYLKKEVTQLLLSLVGKEVAVLSDRDITDFLGEEISDIRFVWHRNISEFSEGYDGLILNFKYSRDFYHLFNEIKENQLLDLYYIVEKVLFDKLFKYCAEKNIGYYFVLTPSAERINCLSITEERRIKQNVALEALLEDDKLVEKIAQDVSDADYLKTRKLNTSFVIYNGFSQMESDVNMTHLHIEKGIRKTLPDITNFEHAVHVYGFCTASGFMVSDEHTIESYMQQLFLDEGEKVKVFNHGTNNGQFLLNDVINALNTPVSSGDNFIFMYENDPVLQDMDIHIYDTCKEINLYKGHTEIFFYDCPQHCNKYANSLIARYLRNIVGQISKVAASQRTTYFDDIGIDISQFQRYDIAVPNLCSFFIRYEWLTTKLSQYSKIGAVVIHAAPFTKGHRHLIDEALKKMDALVVFVLGDFYHSFTVLDRIEIVRMNLEGISNVFIVPLETFATSPTYFPAYANRSNLSYDVALKLMTYCEGDIVDNCIFKFFGIRYRYIGSECEGSFMERYNNLITIEAQKYGITVKMIERAKDDSGNIISASTVRKKLEKNDWVGLESILSKKTIDYLVSNDIKCCKVVTCKN